MESQLFVSVENEKNKLNEEKSMKAHGFSSWLASFVAFKSVRQNKQYGSKGVLEQDCSSGAAQERREEKEMGGGKSEKERQRQTQMSDIKTETET